MLEKENRKQKMEKISKMKNGKEKSAECKMKIFETMKMKSHLSKWKKTTTGAACSKCHYS